MKDSADGSREIKKLKKAVVSDVWKQEENEAATRDANTDLDSFMSTFGNFRKLLSDIHHLKTKGAPGTLTDGEITERKIQGSLMFVVLKKLNRLDKLRSKTIRDATAEARQKVDSFHLQLQNLLYESLHLQKEVTRCLEFKSKDEDIDLISVDDFYREAPKEVSKPDVTKKNPHLQTLARLDWELEQRKRLARRYQMSQETKEKIAQDITTKQDHLDNLAPRLQSILQATRPLQEYLGMPIESEKAQYKMSHYLPSPLFILFVQTSAYRDACEPDLEVKICGEVEEAIALQNVIAERDDDSGDSDQEDGGGQKQRHRRSVSERDVSQKILHTFPLHVSVIVPGKDGARLSLTFYYLPKLHVVTVVTKLTPLPTGAVAGDLLQPETLLSCLLPGDDGKMSPNPANLYQLQKLGMEDVSAYAGQVGRPYGWAQLMAGLEFLSATDDQPGPSGGVLPRTSARTSTSISHMENIVSLIRHRLLARTALYTLIQQLERCSIPILAEHQNKFPVKVHTKLTSWRMSTWADVQHIAAVESYVNEGLIHDEPLVFKLTAERGSVKWQAIVLMSFDYPKTAPIFIVELLPGVSAAKDPAIWAIEVELNLHYTELVDEKSRDCLLANQLQRLLSCIDVYLEQSVSEEPREFPLDRTILRAYRGRDRRIPLRFSPRHGVWNQR